MAARKRRPVDDIMGGRRLPVPCILDAMPSPSPAGSMRLWQHVPVLLYAQW